MNDLLQFVDKTGFVDFYNPAKLQLTQESSLQLLMLPQSRGAQCSGRLSTLPCTMSVQALRSEEVAAVVMVVVGEERWQKIDCKR